MNPVKEIRMINSTKEWAFMNDIHKAPLKEKLGPARIGRTTYPPKPYLSYNEWIKFINKQVDKKYK